MRALAALPFCAAFLLTIFVGHNEAFSQGTSSQMPKWEGFVIRGRAATVIPDEDADISVIGGRVDIDQSLIPEVDISYFFTENIAAELILAITPHDVQAAGTSLGRVDLGDTWLLPPTLLLQYHLPLKGGFKPYIGAGVNYTIFFDENAPGGTVTSIDYENSFGPAVQFGMDYLIDDHWFLNIDVKKIWINTDVEINGGAIKADVDIDPWIIGAGVGYRF